MRLIRYIPLFAVIFLVCPAIVFAAEREVEVFRFEEEEERNPAMELWEKGEIAIRERMFDSAIKYFEEFLKILDKSETDYQQQFIKATEFIVKSHLMMKNADAAVKIHMRMKKKTDSPTITNPIRDTADAGAQHPEDRAIRASRAMQIRVTVREAMIRAMHSTHREQATRASRVM